MTELDMNPATLPADARALYEKMAARRKAQGEGFGGPYLALLRARAPHRGTRLLSQVRGRASAHGLPIHRAYRRTHDRRRLRMARSHRARVRRRPAGGRDRLHRLFSHRRAAAALRPRARDPGENHGVGDPPPRTSVARP